MDPYFDINIDIFEFEALQKIAKGLSFFCESGGGREFFVESENFFMDTYVVKPDEIKDIFSVIYDEIREE